LSGYFTHGLRIAANQYPPLLQDVDKYQQISNGTIVALLQVGGRDFPKRMIMMSNINILVLSAVAVMMNSAYADPTIKSHFEFKKPKMISVAGDISLDQNGALPPSFGSYSAPGVSLGRTFEGISQYDGAAFGRNFIPPDTHGAVGKTQYMETTNGAYAVFDKASGVRT
jgi:hypothetical protein